MLVQVNLQFFIKTKYYDAFHKTRESTGDCIVTALFVLLVWACVAYMKNPSWISPDTWRPTRSSKSERDRDGMLVQVNLQFFIKTKYYDAFHKTRERAQETVSWLLCLFCWCELVLPTWRTLHEFLLIHEDLRAHPSQNDAGLILSTTYVVFRGTCSNNLNSLSAYRK